MRDNWEFFSSARNPHYSFQFTQACSPKDYILVFIPSLFLVAANEEALYIYKSNQVPVIVWETVSVINATYYTAVEIVGIIRGYL